MQRSVIDAGLAGVEPHEERVRAVGAGRAPRVVVVDRRLERVDEREAVRRRRSTRDVGPPRDSDPARRGPVALPQHRAVGDAHRVQDAKHTQIRDSVGRDRPALDRRSTSPGPLVPRPRRRPRRRVKAVHGVLRSDQHLPAAVRGTGQPAGDLAHPRGRPSRRIERVQPAGPAVAILERDEHAAARHQRPAHLVRDRHIRIEHAPPPLPRDLSVQLHRRPQVACRRWRSRTRIERQQRHGRASVGLERLR